MGIELPGEVARFPNVIGVPWSSVDEDQAAATVTGRAARAAKALIVERATKLMSGLIAQLERRVLSAVIGTAVAGVGFGG